MGIEAVKEPVGVRLDGAVPLAMRKQREQSMALVVGVFNDFYIEVLDGRQLGRSDVQSWPKVLRMTQILISTKFAASVSLDIFVRCSM